MFSFFSNREKIIGSKAEPSKIVEVYEQTEKDLKKAAKQGASDDVLSSLMKKHHTAEYSYLYAHKLGRITEKKTSWIDDYQKDLTKGFNTKK